MAEPIIRTPSKHILRRLWGRGLQYDFLEFLTGDLTEWKDDFLGDTLHGGYQSTASGANSVAAAMVTGTVNGEALLDAGDANTGRSDLSLGLHFQGQLNAVMAARIKVNTITNRKLEVGFTDVISGTDAGAVNVRATPSFNADDAVVICHDTTDSAVLKFVGVAATVAGTAYSMNSLITTGFQTYIVALKDGAARAFVLDANGAQIEDTGWQASFITSTISLTPWVFVQNRSGTAGTATIDSLRVWQRKTTG